GVLAEDDVGRRKAGRPLRRRGEVNLLDLRLAALVGEHAKRAHAASPSNAHCLSRLGEVEVEAELALDLAEPVDDLGVVRDALLEALALLLGFEQAGVDDALVAGRRLRGGEPAQELVHVALELLRVDERVDAVRHEVIARLTGDEARAETAQGAREDVDDSAETVTLVRPEFARAAERQQVVLIGAVDLLHYGRAV